MTADTATAIEAIVQQQVEAYNRRDIDGFLACYSATATLYEYPDRLVATGTEQLRNRYAPRFRDSPQLHAAILNRIVLPPLVIDHERVTGLPGGAALEAVVIYEVHGGRIVGARSLAAPRT